MHVCTNTNILPTSQHFLSSVCVGVFLAAASVFLGESQGSASKKQMPKCRLPSLILSVLDDL